MNSISSQYRQILQRIGGRGMSVKNERTGVYTMQYVNEPGVINVDLSGEFPVMGNRKMYPHIAAAEAAWMLMGTQDAEFINNIAPKLWSKFTENGIIVSAYGYRIRHHFSSMDQINKALYMLRKEPSSRQNIICLWDPALDAVFPQKNVPCIVMVTLNVDPSSNRLAMHVYIRSSDLILGLPYDIMCYSFLHHAICNSVDNLLPGSLSLILSNQHVYMLDDHVEVMSRVIGVSRYNDHFCKVPTFSIDDIILDPYSYVNKVKENMVVHNDYNPQLELVL